MRMNEVLDKMERGEGFSEKEFAEADVDELLSKKFEMLLDGCEEKRKSLLRAAFDWFKKYG